MFKRDQKGGERMAALNRTAPLSSPPPLPTLRKFTTQVQPGLAQYTIEHNLGTEDVIVQTRIAGRIREGGVSILDANRVQLTFGGTLNEPIDLVIIG
ncbi:MAG: hypothetical protein ACO1QB_09815 [Verrucomicrobiales bacterium]